MTNKVFSKIDGLSRRFKLVDTLVNSVATRFLPQHEAQAGPGCPSGSRYAGWACGNYCLPTSDLQLELLYLCDVPGGQLLVRQCCDCCS